MKKVMILLCIFIYMFSLSVLAGDNVERMMECDETQDALIVGKIAYMNNSLLKIDVIRVASGKLSTSQVSLLKWYHRDVIETEAFHVGDGVLASVKYTNSARSKCSLAYAIYKVQLMKDKKVKFYTNKYGDKWIESFANTGDFDVLHYDSLDTKYKVPDIGEEMERKHQLFMTYIIVSSIMGTSIIRLIILHKLKKNHKKQ